MSYMCNQNHKRALESRLECFDSDFSVSSLFPLPPSLSYIFFTSLSLSTRLLAVLDHRHPEEAAGGGLHLQAYPKHWE